MHSGTAPSRAGPQTWAMQLRSIKAIVAMLWVSAVCAAAIAGSVQSVSGWTLLAVVAVVPPLVMMWLWDHPAQTMSESIQQARR